jgi:hypothetical protein
MTAAAPQALKIARLEVSNIMKVRAISVTPDTDVIWIGGENAEGKSSFMNSIAFAIGGKKLCPAEPIREGENEAEIRIKLGEFDITRTFTRTDIPGEYRTTLIVRDGEGKLISKPQEMLDRLYGLLAFDPLAFANMAKLDCARTLRELVGLDVEAMETEQADVFERRTTAGQDHRKAKAIAEDLPLFPNAPAELVSVSEIGARMAEAVATETRRQEKMGQIQRLGSDLGANESKCEASRALHVTSGERLESETERLQYEHEAHGIRIDEQIDQLRASHVAHGERLEEELEVLREDHVSHGVRIEEDITDLSVIRRALLQSQSELEQWWEDHGQQSSDVADIQSELDGVEASNEEIRANEKRADRMEEADAKGEIWKKLDTRHEALTKQIREATEAVEYPIEGLELRKGGVYFNRFPFEQASRAQRIRVSMAIGVATNDGLNVLLIRDGSVLDDESMEIVTEFAVANDFQFWIEVNRGYEGKAGVFVIEDGALVEAV